MLAGLARSLGALRSGSRQRRTAPATTTPSGAARSTKTTAAWYLDLVIRQYPRPTGVRPPGDPPVLADELAAMRRRATPYAVSPKLTRPARSPGPGSL